MSNYEFTQYNLRSLEFQDERFRNALGAEKWHLEDAVAEKQPRSVLEVGTGDGRVLFGLWEHGWYMPPPVLIGIDFEKSLLDKAKKRKLELSGVYSPSIGIGNLDFQLMDGRQMSFPDYNFDFVFTAYNSLGGVSPRSREQIVGEMIRVAAGDDGEVHNIVWKNDDFTSQFLADFYPAIGLDVVDIKPDRSILRDKDGRKHIVYRPTPESLVKLYRKGGIERMGVESFGGLLNDVYGVRGR